MKNLTKARIKVLGVGGAGCNTINHMMKSQISGVDFIAINTDNQTLNYNLAPFKLHLGKSGLGAGAKPEIARKNAIEQQNDILNILKNTDMLFITAGMGGGTGTGAAPIVAKLAKQLGILTVGVVCKPFAFEGKKRVKVAKEGIDELLEQVDSLIIIANDNLIKIMPQEATIKQCFSVVDDILKDAVNSIIELINCEGLINVDFEDVKTIMQTKGKSMMSQAFGCGENRAEIAAKNALSSPLLDGIGLACAKNILVNISASKESLKIKECYQIMENLKSIINNNDEDYFIWGAVYDESLGDNLKLTIIATGLENQLYRPEVIDIIENSNIIDISEVHSTKIPAVVRKRRFNEELTKQETYMPAFLKKQSQN